MRPGHVGLDGSLVEKDQASWFQVGLAIAPCGPSFGNVRTVLFGSVQRLIVSIERSLSRLGTDYIDIFQMHTFDALTPVEESLSTLDRFVREGKIRYIGLSISVAGS